MYFTNRRPNVKFIFKSTKYQYQLILLFTILMMMVLKALQIAAEGFKKVTHGEFSGPEAF